MLDLKDFFHLPELEPLLERLVADGPGLTIVAGLDPRPAGVTALPREVGTSVHDGFLPSGRAAIFRILMRQILLARPGANAIVVTTNKETARVTGTLRRRVQYSLVSPSGPYAETIAFAARQRPDLLVIERLTAESVPSALEAAQNGLRVLSQLDTIFCGAEVARQLLDLGVPRSLLHGLAWVIAIQRLATLCSHCREAISADAVQPVPLAHQASLVHLAELRHHYPHLGDTIDGGTFFRAAGCRRCQFTGREGEVAAFDVYRTGTDGVDPLEQPSLLSLEAYMLGLAARGYLPLDDVFRLEADQVRRTYHLLAATERALLETNAELERKLAELDAANRVLQQRTEALVGLESIGQALIASTALDELAGSLCRHARDLCGADRSILYFLHPEQGITEVLAECGWAPSLIHQPLEAALVFGEDVGMEPAAFNHWPPGVPRSPTDLTADSLRAGLRVPLVVQDRRVGLMIVHTSHKSGFSPGEVALLQTFANQAAVAIQRTHLVEALQEKIKQLEAAQAQIATKERMERELELARQVQQSVLPRIFPLVPGYTFAARSDPARWVGGDFYDVIHLDADRFALLIGDVSGKGMPAALHMAQTHSLLQAEARRERSPRAVLYNVHRLLQHLGRSLMFVTVFYGIVDGAERRLTYSRAGHDRPLLLRSGAVQALGGEGTVIGFPDVEELYLSEEQIEFRPGDRLLLYTDGLIDALAPDGRPFGLGRLESLFESHAALQPADLCTTIFADLAAYQAGTTNLPSTPYDDMTLLVLGVQ